MMGPSDFAVNEAWIVLKANSKPMLIQDGDYDCYVLMDAGSAYVFGQILVQQDGEPDPTEVSQLFEDAHREGKGYATRLIVTEMGEVEATCQLHADSLGMTTGMIPANKLLPIIGPMRESFAAMMERRR